MAPEPRRANHPSREAPNESTRWESSMTKTLEILSAFTLGLALAVGALGVGYASTTPAALGGVAILVAIVAIVRAATRSPT